MPSEEDFCCSYIEEHPHSYTREVPVGNILLREEETLLDAASGIFAGSIDALHSPTDQGHERLVECKRTPTFRGLGQLLLYTYFRQRDREIVRQSYAERSGGWQISAERDKRDTHVWKQGTGANRSFHPKPKIDSIEQILAAGNIEPADGPLLSVFTDLDMTVEHRSDGVWRVLEPALFNTATPSDTTQAESYLAANSRSTLDSDAEAEIWNNHAEIFESNTVFKEVPIGSTLFPNTQTSPRADIVVKSGDSWLIIELKDSTTDSARGDFQKGFGQATGYASLFAHEWNLRQDYVIPILIQDPLPVTAGIYRTDRYDDDTEVMMRAARESTTEPAVLGAPLQFG